MDGSALVVPTVWMTLRRKVNREEHDVVPAEFRRWVWAGGRRLKGLGKGRDAEAELYTPANQSDAVQTVRRSVQEVQGTVLFPDALQNGSAEFLCLRDLCGGHALPHNAFDFFGILLSLRGGKIEPGKGPDIILRHALALGIH